MSGAAQPEPEAPGAVLTSSLSQPHISPTNAVLQAAVARVARARDRSEDAIRRLVAEYTQDRQLGFLGEPRVNVLALNLALGPIAVYLQP